MIVKTNDENYKAIAQAIREKTGTDQKYLPEEMAAAIVSIQDGGGTDLSDSILSKSFSGVYKSGALKTVDAYMMQTMQGLTGLYTPSLSNIGSNGFAYCRSLKYAYIKGGTISNLAFVATDSLVSLIITNNETSVLSSIGAFQQSAISSGVGYIYVPDDLVEQYKVATNWATYATQIKGMSEIPAEVQEWINQQEAA